MKRIVGIVDYGVGNLGSLANMVKKAGADPVISCEPEALLSVDRLILPGVGAFDSGVRNLEERGLNPLLHQLVLERKIPILGVCLGMQLLGESSDEGELCGLGWIRARAVRFQFDKEQGRLKVPHMGWNGITTCQPHPLFRDLEVGSRFYFVHSYHLVCSNPSNIVAQTTHGIDFCSAVAEGNVLGVQFHPEKSHRFGLRLVQNFLEFN